jgi:hypothetical protein
MIHEVSPVPHSGCEQKGGEVQEEAVPVPDKLEGVEYVVEYGQRGEGLVWINPSLQKM